MDDPNDDPEYQEAARQFRIEAQKAAIIRNSPEVREFQRQADEWQRKHDREMKQTNVIWAVFGIAIIVGVIFVVGLLAGWWNPFPSHKW